MAYDEEHLTRIKDMAAITKAEMEHDNETYASKSQMDLLELEVEEIDETAKEALEKATGLKAVVSTTDYFCLWDSGTEAPPDNDDLTAAICGTAVCGLTICGVTDGMLWKTEEPYTTAGMYKWTRHYVTCSDGTSEWGTPYCLTDKYNRETIDDLLPEKNIGDKSTPVYVRDGALTACSSISRALESILSSDEWDGGGPYTQTIEMEGVTANVNGVLGLSQSATQTQREAARNACLYITAQGADSITVTADGDLPEVDIPIALILLG